MVRALIIAAIMLTACLGSAKSADWPDRTVSIVSPFSAGGTADILARFVAEQFQRCFNQAAIVEDKVSTDGSIGAGFVAKARPDGYTLLVGSVATHAIKPLRSQLSFDPDSDFEAIGLIATLPNPLVVSNSPPIKTVPVADLGAVAAPLPRGKFTAFIAQERSKWRKTVDARV